MRTDAGGEHHQVDIQRVALRKDHPQAAVIFLDDLCRCSDAHPHPELLDQPTQRLAAALVDLQRH